MRLEPCHLDSFLNAACGARHGGLQRRHLQLTRLRHFPASISPHAHAQVFEDSCNITAAIAFSNAALFRSEG